ncbi:hypothetical protein BD779DRAFT_1675292 [Infundibulicybe gibba]|nr:hypothetical protein BD779DRAFT_1675292 [Infundibulicybe gibba]
MIVEIPRKSSSSRPVTARPLRRGKACMNCRFLKIKCDGVKPICGPCLRHPKDDPCEYSDGPGRSRTKVLEDTVSRLEARLNELEHPEDSTPAVTLSDPYRQFNETRRSSKTPPILSPVSLPFTGSSLSPFSPTSTTSSLPSGRHWNTFSALVEMTESTGSSGSSMSPTRSQSTPIFLGIEEPPFLIIQNLLDKFLPHSFSFGFFLHHPRFYNTALLPLPFGHHSRPSPGLLSVTYLWGVHLSRSEPLLAHEFVFLTRALQHTATDPLGAHPHKILHTLQAEILLSYYFFRTGRFLEAKCHSGAAMSLALGAGFHKIRSSTLSSPSTIGLSSDSSVSLRPPHDEVEEGERINGFWNVTMLQKVVAVALEPPTSVCGALDAPGTQVDTPWPLDMEDYKEGLLHPGLTSNWTVKNFLNNFPTDQQGSSTIALNVKASILFHRAAHLTGQWTPNLQPRENQAFTSAFHSVNRLIEILRHQLLPLPSLDPSHPSTRVALLTHTLVDAATIKLHSIFSYVDPSSKQKCLDAARNMVKFGGLSLQDLGYMNPIMGTLWTTACHVFIDEVSRVRSLRDAWSHSAPDINEEELMEGLRNGMTALSLFSEDSTLMSELHIFPEYTLWLQCRLQDTN